VEPQPGDQPPDGDDRPHDEPGHDFTFPRTRPRKRWCCRPSARTASTPVATCGISTVSAVFAFAALSVSLTATTRRSMVFPREMRRVSRTATATQQTRPTMGALTHREVRVEA